MSEHVDGEVLSALLDGALGAQERARAEAHAAACAKCRRELDSLRHMKLVAASAPRKTMPADLALTLERRFVSAAPAWKALLKPAFWIPAGTVAAAALTVGLWLNRSSEADELPLEPLIAAHERYSAESLVPQVNLVASAYSEQVAPTDADAADSELE
jgi:anti-sigma factor RsiW